MRIPLNIEYVGEIQLGIEMPDEVQLGLETVIRAADVPEYTGDYVFTPTEDTQTVQIRQKMATSNITINPIPSNYGLITYDGVNIRVS